MTRDALDRPVIRAGTARDAAFGLGRAVAEHRREQMDLLARRAHGRLAEVAGRAELDGDVMRRSLGLERIAHACRDALPSAQRELLDAFSAGVNSAGTAAPGRRGERLTPWTPVASIAVAQLMFQSLASDGSELRMVEVMRRTLPVSVTRFLLSRDVEYATAVDGARAERPVPSPVPRAELAALLAEPPPGGPRPLVVAERRPIGSNAWAVAGADGPAVLASDMHLDLTFPSTWYAVRLELPWATVAGVTVPGLPVVVAGTNGAVAWGFTRLPGDTVDVREVEAGLRQGTYRCGDQELPFSRRREVIKVRGEPAVELEVLGTQWGPVTGELAGRRLALDSTLLDPTALDFRVADLYTARDVDDAVAVVTDSGLPPLNAVLADSHGRVAWTVTGRFRRRPEPGPRGFTSCTARTAGRVPPGDLPRVVDPPSGLVLSCNDDSGPAWAAGLAWNSFCGSRARRVARVVASAPHDEAAASELQVDVDAGYYDFYRDLALRHVPADIAVPALRTARDLIAAWSGSAGVDEPGLALLVPFRDLLREELIAAATRPARRYDPDFVYCYNGHETAVRRWLQELDGLVPRPWRSARHFVRGQLLLATTLVSGGDGAQGGGRATPGRWGEANRLRLISLGGAPPVPPPDAVELAGCPEAVRVCAPDFGASMRLVVSPGRPARARLTIPGSASATPASNDEHVRRWAAGATTPLFAPAAGEPVRSPAGEPLSRSATPAPDGPSCR